MKTRLLLPPLALLMFVGMTHAKSINAAAEAAAATTGSAKDDSSFQPSQSRNSSSSSSSCTSFIRVNTLQKNGNQSQRHHQAAAIDAAAAGTFLDNQKDNNQQSASSSSPMISTIVIDKARQKKTRLAAAALHGVISARLDVEMVQVRQARRRGVVGGSRSSRNATTRTDPSSSLNDMHDNDSDSKDRPMSSSLVMQQPPSSILHVSWLRGGGGDDGDGDGNNGSNRQPGELHPPMDHLHHHHSSPQTTQKIVQGDIQQQQRQQQPPSESSQEELLHVEAASSSSSSSSFSSSSSSSSSVVVANVGSKKRQQQAKLQVSLSEPLLPIMTDKANKRLSLLELLRGGGVDNASSSMLLGTTHQTVAAAASVAAQHGGPFQQPAAQGRRLATASSSSAASSNVVIPATVSFEKKRQAEIHGLSLSSPLQGLQINTTPNNRNTRQRILEKLRGGSQMDAATTCKFAIHFMLLQGLLQQVAPAMYNRRLYGIVANTPLHDAIMENLGTTALSFGLAAYCIVLQETSLATAIQVSCIPWIYISLCRFLNYPPSQSKQQQGTLSWLNTDQTPRHVHLMIVLDMLLICHAVSRLQQHSKATDHWALDVLQGHCAIWFLQGLGLVLNPVGTTKLLWWGLRSRNTKNKDMPILPGVAVYLQRNFGYSLLAWSTFTSAMMLWDVDPRTSMGYGWIFWALLHFTGTLLTRECSTFGIPQAPQYAWLVFHATVMATILF